MFNKVLFLVSVQVKEKKDSFFNDRFYLSFFVATQVTLTTIQFRIHPRTKVDPMFQCVYISTPLKSCPYKSSATCA